MKQEPIDRGVIWLLGMGIGPLAIQQTNSKQAVVRGQAKYDSHFWTTDPPNRSCNYPYNIRRKGIPAARPALARCSGFTWVAQRTKREIEVSLALGLH